MHSYKNYFTALSLCSSVILLTACGGSSSTNNSNETTNPDIKPQPFQSSFSSTLTIEEKSTNASKKYEIQSKSTNEKDSVLAYSVITELGNTLQNSTDQGDIQNPRLNQMMRFALGENSNTFNLDIQYNPLLKKVTFLP